MKKQTKTTKAVATGVSEAIRELREMELRDTANEQAMSLLEQARTARKDVRTYQSGDSVNDNPYPSTFPVDREKLRLPQLMKDVYLKITPSSKKIMVFSQGELAFEIISRHELEQFGKELPFDLFNTRFKIASIVYAHQVGVGFYLGSDRHQAVIQASHDVTAIGLRTTNPELAYISVKPEDMPVID